MKKKQKDFGAISLALHKKHRGKLMIMGVTPVTTLDQLSVIYTPGVAAVSSHLALHPNDAPLYTMKGTTVAVVTDGSAVLGLGNIGPVAALPVMEGKAVLFKQFANINAIPIVLDTQDTEEIIRIVKAIAPGFGGINLEDISAPRSFVIEERLKKELSIPVMHDDQHGTAIVILAGLINALTVVHKKISEVKIVISGAGGAGSAFAKLALLAGVTKIILVDRQGALYKKRQGITPEKLSLAKITNPDNKKGTLAEVLVGADVFVGVSSPNLVTKEMVEGMNAKSIVFALANPTPEILPEAALRAGAFVVATGRSDFPNQLNNALVFPGVFRGALDNGVRQITDTMKLNAAFAIASLIKKPTNVCIVPDIFDPRLVKTIAKVITDK